LNAATTGGRDIVVRRNIPGERDLFSRHRREEMVPARAGIDAYATRDTRWTSVLVRGEPRIRSRSNTNTERQHQQQSPWLATRLLGARLVEIRIVAIQRARTPDRLHNVGANLFRDLARGLFRLHVGCLRERNLHELVRPQRIIDGLQQGVRESLMTHVHEWIQMMCFSTELGALLRRQCH
jgi:hypothetical protein